jgi:hypothetical protein
MTNYIQATATRKGSCIIPRVAFNPRAKWKRFSFITEAPSYTGNVQRTSVIPKLVNNTPYTFRQV